MAHPGEELIKSLEILRNRLNNSGLERTHGLLIGLGDDCTYYRKSLDLFSRRDLEEISSFLDRAKEQLDKIK